MSEGIVGIDEPEGSRRLEWWHWIALVLAAAAAIFWVVDALRTTETERVAAAVQRLLDAYAEEDADAFCEVVTEQVREDAILAAQGRGEEVDTCTEAAASELNLLASLDVDTDGFDDIDAADLEDLIEVDGDRAAIRAEDDLIENGFNLIREDGEWRVDLTDAGGAVRTDLPIDASSDELIDAADSLCVRGFSNSSLAIAALLEGLEAGDPSTFRENAEKWLQAEEELLAELEELSTGQTSAVLEPLISNQRKQVKLAGNASSDLGSFNRAIRRVAAHSTKMASDAEEQGFSKLGCAAPAVGDL